MKKFFTILMAVLCLSVFCISDASAKTRKRSNNRNSYPNSGTYVICSSINPDFVIDLDGAIATNSRNIQLYISNQTAAQKWVFEECGKRTFYIRSVVNPNYVIDLDGAIIDNQRNIQLYEFNGTDAQKWVLEKVENNTYLIKSLINPSYVIDLDGAIIDNQRNIQLYEYNGTNAQKWILTKADNATNRTKTRNNSRNVDFNGSWTYVYYGNKATFQLKHDRQTNQITGWWIADGGGTNEVNGKVVGNTAILQVNSMGEYRCTFRKNGDLNVKFMNSGSTFHYVKD